LQTKKKDPQKTLANLVKRHRALDDEIKSLQANPPKSADPKWEEELKKLKTKKCELKTRIQQMSKALNHSAISDTDVSDEIEQTVEDEVLEQSATESGDCEQEAA